MSDVVVRVEKLGKKYRIHHQQERQRYLALRDVFAAQLLAPWLWLSNRRAQQNDVHRRAMHDFSNPKLHRSWRRSQMVEEFWALKDISFEIKQGEVVGIIGRNGAGKSTLLKILSRITDPTEGRVQIKGRVASLLEVGTGFHPELTGRENIFLNGAILGMSRAEIKQKFDQIVSFAEVEKFLDTPVKRFSSGMYVRLAFAVAAHLEPDILVVDEVLAVGDAEFQKKCLGKMQEVSATGRTVLFVSHNMAAVQTLCKTGILFSRGRLDFKGISQETIAQYLKTEANETGEKISRNFSKALSLTRLTVSPLTARSHQKMLFEVELQASEDEIITDLALLIHAQNGERAALIDLRSTSGPYRLAAGKCFTAYSEVATMPFVEGDFNLGLYVNAESVCQSFMDLLTFTVLPSEAAGGIVPRDPQYRGLVDLSVEVRTGIS